MSAVEVVAGEVTLLPGGSLSLTEAFRSAKILAGWEAPVRGHSGGNPRWPRKESARIRCGLAPRTGLCVGEPVCRNLRGEHGDFVGRSKP